ncbi:hypothetical protein ACOMHN_030667 [Nucella lapillus]
MTSMTLLVISAEEEEESETEEGGCWTPCLVLCQPASSSCRWVLDLVSGALSTSFIQLQVGAGPRVWCSVNQLHPAAGGCWTPCNESSIQLQVGAGRRVWCSVNQLFRELSVA